MQTLKIASLVLAGAVLTVACGDSNASLNPTAPSAVSAAVQQDPDAATGGESSTTGGPKNNNGNGNGNNGNGNGNGKGRGGNDQPTVPSAPTPPPGNVTPPSNTTPSNTTPTGPIVGRLQIEGLITEVDDNTIIVNGKTVFVPEAAVIRHGNRRYELDDLRPGDRVHVVANRVATQGSTPTAAASGDALVATEVKLQNPGDDADDDSDDDDDEGDDDGGTSGTTRVRPKGGS